MELAIEWQRPRVPLDEFTVLLLNPDGAAEVARLSGSKSGCQLRLDDYTASSLSVTVVAWCAGIASPPCPPLTLNLAPPLLMGVAQPIPAALPVINPAVATAPPTVSIAAPPASPVPPPVANQPTVELVDDLAAIDMALGEASAFLGQNGVFVRFKEQR